MCWDRFVFRVGVVYSILFLACKCFCIIQVIYIVNTLFSVWEPILKRYCSLGCPISHISILFHVALVFLINTLY